jgi:Domain of unknown function (DUF4129)
MRRPRPGALPPGAARAGAVCLALVALLALLALASRPEAPWGAGGVDWPTGSGSGVDRAAFALTLVFAAVGLWLLLRTAAGSMGRSHVPRRDPWLAMFTWGVAAILLVYLGREADPKTEHRVQIARPREREPEHYVPPVRHGSSDRDLWLLVGVGVGVLALIVGIEVWLRRRRRAEAPPEPAPAAPMAAEVDDLEALRAEPDPRRAVIGAYAGMERTLAGRGVGRLGSEAPEEYLGRVRSADAAVGPEAARLTTLYQRARFCARPVAAAMRDEAIGALVRLRSAAAREAR